MCCPVEKYLPQGECAGPVMDQPAAQQVEAVPRPKSDYRGLSWDRKHAGWRVRIYYRSKQRHIGRYTNEIEAAKAYDKAAYYLYGEAAITNFGIHSAREDQSQVSEFIVQAKQQVHANDQRQGMHHGASSRAMQQLLEDRMMHMQQQNHMCSTGEIVWQQAQQYTPRMVESVNSSSQTAVITAVAPPNIAFHTSSSFSHLQSPTADISTLNYSSSACMASPVASAAAAAQPQLVVLPTPAAGALAAVQPGCSAAPTGPWTNGIFNSSLSSQNSSVLMGNILTMVQQQQLHQVALPAAAGAPPTPAAAAAGANFTTVSLPLGVQFVTSLPLLPPKVPLQQQQQLQQQQLQQQQLQQQQLQQQSLKLYDTAGWTAQQQQVPQSQAQQVLFCGQGKPVQLSVQPQMVSIAGHMSTPATAMAAAAAIGSPASKGCQHEQQQLLLEAQLQSMSLLDRPAYSTSASNAWQLLSPQMGSSAGTPSAAAAAAATGVHRATCPPEQLSGNTHPAAAGGVAMSPLSSPFAGPVLLQSGTPQEQQQQQQQGEALGAYCHWRH